MNRKLTKNAAQLQAEIDRISKELILATDIIDTLKQSNKFYKNEYEKLRDGTDPASQTLDMTMRLVRILQDQNAWMQKNLSDKCSGLSSRINPELNGELDRAAAKSVEDWKRSVREKLGPVSPITSRVKAKKINLICIDPGETTGLEHLERYTANETGYDEDGVLCYRINELDRRLKKVSRFYVSKSGNKKIK